MSKLTAIAVILFLISARSFAQVCMQDPTECFAYCQLGSALHCESSNYLYAFGYKYCRAYLDKERFFSPRGQEILRKIRPCLIDFLERQSGLTCANVKPIAEESHVGCYVENGFCDLSLEDKARIFNYAKREVFDVSIMEVMGKVVRTCERLNQALFW